MTCFSAKDVENGIRQLGAIGTGKEQSDDVFTRQKRKFISDAAGQSIGSYAGSTRDIGISRTDPLHPLHVCLINAPAHGAVACFNKGRIVSDAGLLICTLKFKGMRQRIHPIVPGITLAVASARFVQCEKIGFAAQERVRPAPLNAVISIKGLARHQSDSE